MKILTAHQMRNIDRRAISRYGVPGLLLMENAGRAVVEQVLEAIEEREQAGDVRIAIVCGRGNNGGDGLVVARHLHDLGRTPTVFLYASPEDLEGDASTNLRMLEKLPVPLKAIQEHRRWRELGGGENPLAGFDVVVDALLGTGLKGKVRGGHEALIKDINDSGAIVVSVDIPSGLSGDSAEILGATVRASCTVTFVAPKIPHLFPPAEEYCGEVVVARIGVPDEAVEAEEVRLEWVDEDVLAGRFPARPAASHKGDFGHALVVGGSLGKSGAVRLAAQGVLTGGAGLVTAAVPKGVRVEVAAYAPAMTLPVAETSEGGLGRRALPHLRQAMPGKSVLVVGMGAGTEKETQATLRSLVTGAAIPVVLDADGLNAFAGQAETLSGEQRPLVLTPHPGEMARLTGLTASQVQADRIEVCRRFAINHACHVVLKGYRTLIGSPEGGVHVNSTGNVGLATAGTGDVLAGLLGGLIASGLPILDALLLGVFGHGLAADLAGEETGEAAMTSDILLAYLPRAMRQVAEIAA